VVISPDVSPELASMAVEVRQRPYREGDLEGAFLAFAATDRREVNAAVAWEAQERGIPVNVADEPSEGDFVLAGRRPRWRRGSAWSSRIFSGTNGQAWLRRFIGCGGTGERPGTS
jgi:hypothetical protein